MDTNTTNYIVQSMFYKDRALANQPSEEAKRICSPFLSQMCTALTANAVNDFAETSDITIADICIIAESLTERVEQTIAMLDSLAHLKLLSRLNELKHEQRYGKTISL